MKLIAFDGMARRVVRVGSSCGGAPRQRPLMFRKCCPDNPSLLDFFRY